MTTFHLETHQLALVFSQESALLNLGQRVEGQAIPTRGKKVRFISGRLSDAFVEATVMRSSLMWISPDTKSIYTYSPNVHHPLRPKEFFDDISMARDWAKEIGGTAHEHVKLSSYDVESLLEDLGFASFSHLASTYGWGCGATPDWTRHQDVLLYLRLGNSKLIETTKKRHPDDPADPDGV